MARKSISSRNSEALCSTRETSTIRNCKPRLFAANSPRDGSWATTVFHARECLRSKASMLRKCDLPEPKCPFRNIPRPWELHMDEKTAFRFSETSPVTTKVSVIMRRRPASFRSCNWITVLISGTSTRSPINMLSLALVVICHLSFVIGCFALMPVASRL